MKSIKSEVSDPLISAGRACSRGRPEPEVLLEKLDRDRGLFTLPGTEPIRCEGTLMGPIPLMELLKS